MKRLKLTLLVFGSALVGSVLDVDGFLFENLVQPASAEVAGMDWYDLRRDRDFQRAVEYIIENYDFEGIVEVTIEDCISEGAGQHLYC